MSGKKGIAPGPAGHSYEHAMTAWGVDMPDWVSILAKACDATSQKKVGKIVGYNHGTINQVIHNKYPAPHHVEQAVRAKLLGDTVTCPVEQVISLVRCRQHQEHSRHFRPTSELRIQLYHACKRCPHFRQNIKPESSAEGQTP